MKREEKHQKEGGRKGEGREGRWRDFLKVARRQERERGVFGYRLNGAVAERWEEEAMEGKRRRSRFPKMSVGLNPGWTELLDKSEVQSLSSKIKRNKHVCIFYMFCEAAPLNYKTTVTKRQRLVRAAHQLLFTLL